MLTFSPSGVRRASGQPRPVHLHRYVNDSIFFRQSKYIFLSMQISFLINASQSHIYVVFTHFQFACSFSSFNAFVHVKVEVLTNSGLDLFGVLKALGGHCLQFFLLQFSNQLGNLLLLLLLLLLLNLCLLCCCNPSTLSLWQI